MNSIDDEGPVQQRARMNAAQRRQGSSPSTAPLKARPKTLRAPLAPPRPSASQLLADANLPAVNAFLEALDGGGTPLHSAVAELLFDEGCDHPALWLLFEADVPSTNGQLMIHPAVDAELVRWIIQRPRHGSKRPRHSDYLWVLTEQSRLFAEFVVRVSDDPWDVLYALSRYKPWWGSEFIPNVLLKSLSWPADGAMAVINRIRKLTHAELTADVQDLLQRAEDSATGGLLPSEELRSLMQHAAGSSTERRVVSPARVDALVKDFRKLSKGHDGKGVGALFAIWDSPLPWDRLMDALPLAKWPTRSVAATLHQQEVPVSVIAPVLSGSSGHLGILRRRTPSWLFPFLFGNPSRWLPALQTAGKSPCSPNLVQTIGQGAFVFEPSIFEQVSGHMSLEQQAQTIELALLTLVAPDDSPILATFGYQAWLSTTATLQTSSELIQDVLLRVAADERVDHSRLALHLPQNWASRYLLMTLS